MNSEFFLLLDRLLPKDIGPSSLSRYLPIFYLNYIIKLISNQTIFFLYFSHSSCESKLFSFFSPMILFLIKRNVIFAGYTCLSRRTYLYPPDIILLSTYTSILFIYLVFIIYFSNIIHRDFFSVILGFAFLILSIRF